MERGQTGKGENRKRREREGDERRHMRRQKKLWKMCLCGRGEEEGSKYVKKKS